MRHASHLGPLVIDPVTGHVTNPSRSPSPSHSAEDTRDIPEMPTEPAEGPQPLPGFLEFMENGSLETLMKQHPAGLQDGDFLREIAHNILQV